jgi:uroporphyrinogen-III decarboxylase
VIDGYYLSYLATLGYRADVADAVRMVGGDIIERHVPACRFSYTGGVTYHQEERRDGTLIARFETPVGMLTQVSEYIHGSETYRKFLIETREDLRIMQYVEEHKQVVPSYEPVETAEARIGEDGIATVSASSTPLATLSELCMGLESFVYMLHDYTAEMESLMSVMHENNKQEHAILARSPSPVVFMYEDTSTTTISRELYQRYCRSQIDDYAAIVHRERKPYIVHMCGKLKGMADLIGATAMDGVDSLCPPTTGDLWAHEALTLWPDKVVVGGLEPAYLQRASVPEVRAYVLWVLENAAPSRGLVLSTGDATAYGTPLENLHAVTEVVRGFNTRRGM